MIFARAAFSNGKVKAGDAVLGQLHLAGDQAQWLRGIMQQGIGRRSGEETPLGCGLVGPQNDEVCLELLGHFCQQMGARRAVDQ